MSPTPRHWPFLRAFGEKGLRLEHKALEFSQKAEERELEGRRAWIGLIAELEGVLVRQVGKMKESTDVTPLNISSFCCF